MRQSRRPEEGGTRPLKPSNLDSGLFRVTQAFSLIRALGREKTGMTFIEVNFDATRSPLTYGDWYGALVHPIGDCEYSLDLHKDVNGGYGLNSWVIPHINVILVFRGGEGAAIEGLDHAAKRPESIF